MTRLSQTQTENRRLALDHAVGIAKSLGGPSPRADITLRAAQAFYEFLEGEDFDVIKRRLADR